MSLDQSLRDLCENNGVLIVGVSGKIGSGKSTLCDNLLLLHNQNVVARNFADQLKIDVAAHLGIPLERCYTEEGKNTRIERYDMTVGCILQQWGTALRSAIHTDMWVIATANWLERLILNGVVPSMVVIGDVRFPNEVDWVHSVGGVAVRLNGDPGGVRAKSTRDLAHVSETALDDCQDKFDLVINSDNHSASEVCQMVLTLMQSVRWCSP